MRGVQGKCGVPSFLHAGAGLVTDFSSSFPHLCTRPAALCSILKG